MKAVILVGGEGTRLRPLTSNLPKPMIPLVNRPFLEHVLEYLKSYGITDVILSMCYRPDVIEGHFGNGAGFGVNLTYVVEEKPLGTAGGVKNVEQNLDGTSYIFNGDILTDLDLSAMLEYHRAKGAKATISLTPVEDPTAYGLVETEAEGAVIGFIEKPTWDRVTTNLINAGTYVVEPEIFRYVPPNQHYMFERGLFPVMLQVRDPLYGYPSNSYWIDIGTPQKYLTAHRDLLTGRMPKSLPGHRLYHNVWAGEGCDIHPSAKLTGPIVLGNGVRIGAGAALHGPVCIGDRSQVGRDSVIEDAVIWTDTVIQDHVTMKSCVVANHCVIEDNTWITQGAVVGDHCVIGAGNRLEQGIRIWPNRSIDPNSIAF